MWQILKLTQSKVQRKSGTRYHQDILLYWEKWAVGKPLQTCLEGTWTGLGSKLHCSCSPVEGNVPFLKQQPCCSRKESHFPWKEIIKSFRKWNIHCNLRRENWQGGKSPPTNFYIETNPTIRKCNWEKGLPQLVRAPLSVQEALMGDLKVSTICVAALNIHGMKHCWEKRGKISAPSGFFVRW